MCHSSRLAYIDFLRINLFNEVFTVQQSEESNRRVQQIQHYLGFMGHYHTYKLYGQYLSSRDVKLKN